MVFWTVIIGIEDNWIADGFRLDPDKLKDAIDERMLAGLTHEGEIVVRITKSPGDHAIQCAEKRHEKAVTAV
jgi:hypothetical protein